MVPSQQHREARKWFGQLYLFQYDECRFGKPKLELHLFSVILPYFLLAVLQTIFGNACNSQLAAGNIAANKYLHITISL
jgi:hypothetical protein